MDGRKLEPGGLTAARQSAAVSPISQRLKRGAAFLAVALLATGLGVLFEHTHLLRRLEQPAIDARYQVRGTDRAKTDGVVLVTVDSSTFNAFRQAGLKLHWPFPRRYTAQVIEELRRSGAKAIGLDMEFLGATDRRDDTALLNAIDRAGNVVLAATETGPGGSTDVLGGDAVLGEVGAKAGNVLLIADSDGVLRSTQYSIGKLETFAVALQEVASGEPVASSLFGGLVAPAPIDYAGPPETFETMPYSSIYKSEFDRGSLAGKVVIVGASASSLKDLHQTPMSGAQLMAGPEVLANEFTTVRAGLPLRHSSDAAVLLLCLALSLLVCGAALRLRALGTAIVGLGLAVAWAGATQLAFDAGTILDFTDPAASLALSTVGAVLLGLWSDGREQRQLRELFAAGEAGLVDETLRHPPGASLEPTSVIAGYRVEEIIGRGGMGVVYRADQLALGRPVALKLIATSHAHDPTFRARFTTESRLAASIEHANVIPVYEAGEDDGLLFIAMRLVDGPDLAQVLHETGPLEPARVARLAGQIAGALDAAHSRGLIHRDVKPANVLLTTDTPEHAYLTDFGVAKQIDADEGMTLAGRWVGTLDYLSPEQIRGERAGPAADIYALAGVVHHCLTGQTPFPRENDAARMWAHVNAPAPAPSSLRPGLPVAVDAVIACGLAKQPGDRYGSATEFAEALARALGFEVSEPATPAPEPARADDGPAVAPTVLSE